MTLDLILGSRNRVRALRALLESDGLSGRRVASRSGASPSASKAALDELVEAGIVLRAGTPGKHSYELNRSHHLLGALEALFQCERRTVERVARLARGVLVSEGAPRAAWLTVSPEAGVSLAVSPLPDPSDPAVQRFRSALRYEFGLTLEAVVGSPSELPAGRRVAVLPTHPWSEPSISAEHRSRALRFFGLGTATGGDADG